MSVDLTVFISFPIITSLTYDDISFIVGPRPARVQTISASLYNSRSSIAFFYIHPSTFGSSPPSFLHASTLSSFELSKTLSDCQEAVIIKARMPSTRKYPDAHKATQLSPHAQALLDKQRHQNRGSLFVRSLVPTGQMTGSPVSLPLDRSDPYLPVIYESQPDETIEEKSLESFRNSVKMGDLKAAYGTGDLVMDEARLKLVKESNQLVQDTHKQNAEVSTRYRIRYQPEIDGELSSPKRGSTGFAPVFRRHPGSSTRLRLVTPTTLSRDHENQFSPSFAHGPRRRLDRVRVPVGASPAFYADDVKPSDNYGPTFGTRLVRRSMKVQEQSRSDEEDSKSCSSTAYIDSTLLSGNSLNVQEELSFLMDDYDFTCETQEQPDLNDAESGSISSTESTTSTLVSSSSPSVAEYPVLSNDPPSTTFTETNTSLPNAEDGPLAPLRTASSFLVSTLTSAAFLPPIHLTDTILWVKVGSRILSRVIPLNMSSEARARCDAGNPFVEGLLTSTVELKPRCLKGLTQIEGVLMDEVAKILTAESLADLKKYDGGTESRAELSTDLDEELQVVHDWIHDKLARRLDEKEESNVKASMPMHGIGTQHTNVSRKHVDVMMNTFKMVDHLKILPAPDYMMLDNPMPVDAANTKTTISDDKQSDDQDWEMLDANMKNDKMGKTKSVILQGYGEAWTLL